MHLKNLREFQVTRREPFPSPQSVSVLIPARNEEANLPSTLGCILDSKNVNLEVIVLDDNSSDRTAAIVSALAEKHRNLRIVTSQPLPEEWNGKQHACWQLAHEARFENMLFLDADVRLQSDALARLCAQFELNEAKLISGFPNQEMGSISEQMLIPMMYYLLLGYLPIPLMRTDISPEYGAGCGQLFFTDRTSYFACGGHRSIQQTRHDGLQLPRSYRRSGMLTDVIDASDIASVRMYRGVRETMNGLLKNADEGIANRKLLGIFSLLLLGAAPLPIAGFAHAIYHGWFGLDRMYVAGALLFALSTLLSFVPRLLIATRFRHSLLGVLLHPISILWFLSLQWIAFLRSQMGLSRPSWRGRKA